jgi:hypothetical protein
VISLKKSHLDRPDLVIGPLPHDVINKTLGMELHPGEVIFTRAAQIHAARRHPAEFPHCLPHVGTVVLNPLYIGDDGRNPEKIELIARIQALGQPLLVAHQCRAVVRRELPCLQRLSAFRSEGSKAKDPGIFADCQKIRAPISRSPKQRLCWDAQFQISSLTVARQLLYPLLGA